MDLLYDGEMDLCSSVSKNAEPRGLWTSNDLQSAINKVKSGITGVNKTSKSFNIPKTTLKRKIKSNNTEECNRLDPDSTLGANAEKKFANHIKKLQKNDFSPTKQEVREMAYKVVVELGIKHPFNETVGNEQRNRWFGLVMR
ncbi:hypothetical protein ILUMI_14350 [Ignelater luminosus]|uniref:HTH psq-type domain-containing protein n=1 Tax=Ignelater luminosus TaxID=2038154 RepID=A0A8K0GB10_IGNLU|nr:hypothetical protein ILUMI_14350 [Ignelater luminosus]